MYMRIFYIILECMLKTDRITVTKYKVHRSVFVNLAMMLLVS